MADLIAELREKITLAREKGNWAEVRVLAEDMVQRTTGNGFALRALVQACEHIGDPEPLPSAWAALVDDAREPLPYAGHLAAWHLKNGHRNRALHYYRVAIEAAIEGREYELVETFWLELVDAAPELLPEYCRYAAALRRHNQHERAATLLGVVQEYYQRKGTPDERLALTRELAFCLPADPQVRKDLCAAVRLVHGKHPELDRLIAHAGLDGNRPLDEAIVELERELAFDRGECVHHSGWGVGVIRKLDTARREITIDFKGKPGHVMTLEMAERTLVHLDPEDFRSLAATRAADLPRMAAEEPTRLVRAALRACGGSATVKDIKALLLDTAVLQRDWTGWWSNASEQLKRDPFVEVNGAGASRRFALREHPLSPSEEFWGRFEQAHGPLDRLAVLAEFVREMPAGERDEAVVRRMFDALAQQACSGIALPVRVTLSLALAELADIAGLTPLAALPSLESLVPSDPQAALAVLKALESMAHKAAWVRLWRKRAGQSWTAIVEQTLPDSSDSVRDVLIRELDAEDRERILGALFVPLLQAPRHNVGLFLWLAREALAGQQVRWNPATPLAIIEQVLSVLDFVAYRSRHDANREVKVRMREHLSAARRVLKLGGYGVLRDLVDSVSITVAGRLLDRISHNPGLDEQMRKDITRLVYEVHPDLAHREVGVSEAEGEDEATGPLLCTRAAFMAVQDRLRHIREHEVPRNARDIQVARAHGDLRENAEYHAARDRRRFLNAQMADLEAGLRRARVVEARDVNTDKIGFGTRVVLRDAGSGQRREIVVLGPWESAPERGVYSVQSPLVEAMVGATVGVPVRWTEGGETTEMIVESISNALADDNVMIEEAEGSQL